MISPGPQIMESRTVTLYLHTNGFWTSILACCQPASCLAVALLYFILYSEWILYSTYIRFPYSCTTSSPFDLSK